MALAENTGWGNSTDAAVSASATGEVAAFAFASGSNDCALILSRAHAIETNEIHRWSCGALAAECILTRRGRRIPNHPSIPCISLCIGSRLHESAKVLPLLPPPRGGTTPHGSRTKSVDTGRGASPV